MSTPRASILVPTLNGAAHLARLLPALAGQELAGGRELVVLDSDSDDGTRALCEAAGARVLRIARADFAHGPARNRLAREARGELCVFLSQDAVPDGPDFLRELLAPFDDPRVAGVTARVLPHDDDDPLTRRTALDAPKASAEPHTFELARGERLADLPPAERVARLRFNDVASAMRRAVHAELPFPDVAFGEDLAWAARALAAGHRIAFAPRAVVRHAHRYGPGTAFRRYRTDARFLLETQGLAVRPGALSLARGFAHELARDLRYLARTHGPGRLAALARAPGLRAGQVLGQYAGSRSGAPAPGGSHA
jgi:rhamnosyltransferase